MKRRFPWFSYLVVIIGGVAMVLPFLDMVMSSFKGAGEYGVIPYRLLPSTFEPVHGASGWAGRDGTGIG